MLKMKIQKITGENVSLGEEVREAQENLRLSANTQAKLNKQLNEYKARIDANDRESDTYKQRMQKLLSENQDLGEEVRTAQQNLRLSANTVSKLNSELKMVCNENEELRKNLEMVSGTTKKSQE